MVALQVGGVHVHYDDAGVGAPVVWVHGGATTSRYWDAVCAELPKGIRTMTLIEPPIYGLLVQSGLTDLYREIASFRSTFDESVAKGEDEAAMELLVDRFSGIGTWAKMSRNMHMSLLGVVQPLLVGFAANAQNPTRIEDCQRDQDTELLPWGEQTGEPEKAMVELLGHWLPNARTVPIPGARHQSPISHPREVATFIAGHVAEHDSLQPPL